MFLIFAMSFFTFHEIKFLGDYALVSLGRDPLGGHHAKLK